MKPLSASRPISLFRKAFSSPSTGRRALSPSFFTIVIAWEKVIGTDSNAALVSSAALKMAAFTTSAVILPSLASSRISPMVTPMYCEIARVMVGACSRTEFSSSPRRTPEDMAWVSWSIAACAPWALVDRKSVV